MTTEPELPRAQQSHVLPFDLSVLSTFPHKSMLSPRPTQNPQFFDNYFKISYPIELFISDRTTMPNTILKLVALLIALTLLNAQDDVQQAINTPAINEQPDPSPESLHSQQQRRRQEYIQSIQQQHQQNKESQKSGSLKQQQRKQFERKLAQQSKIVYEQYRKEQEDRQKRQEQERIKLASENVMTATQQRQTKQNREMHDQFNKLRSGPNRQFNQYSFNLETNTVEDFKISIPINQQIVFFVEIFTSKDGAFSPPDDIDNEQPLWIYVYHDNLKILYQKQLYFKTFGTINGEANSTYLFRFVNHGSDRLIFFRPMLIIQNTHVYDLITNEDVADHGVRLKYTKNQIYTKLNQLNTKFVLQNQNKKKLLTGLTHYYFYSIFEIVLIAILCILQVEFVQKLLSTTSVI